MDFHCLINISENIWIHGNITIIIILVHVCFFVSRFVCQQDHTKTPDGGWSWSIIGQIYSWCKSRNYDFFLKMTLLTTSQGILHESWWKEIRHIQVASIYEHNWGRSKWKSGSIDCCAFYYQFHHFKGMKTEGSSTLNSQNVMTYIFVITVIQWIMWISHSVYLFGASLAGWGRS